MPPAFVGRAVGATRVQISMANGQRGLNLQPGGGFAGSAGSA
jgi:hypothetical protein